MYQHLTIQVLKIISKKILKMSIKRKSQLFLEKLNF